MGGYVYFQMWGPFRESLIQKHLFYVEQARSRLLSRFESMEKEADEAAERWLQQSCIHFDPDRDDTGSYYERANDVGIEFYQLLDDMRGRTQLSVIAGLFHEWDKQLRDWLVGEIRRWHRGDLVPAAIWKAEFLQVAELLDSLGWGFSASGYFKKMDACRLVVNVYKHGDGKSFQDLKANFPEYLRSPLFGIGEGKFDAGFLDHKDLAVSDLQIQEFAAAVVEFWRGIPENTCDSDALPAWLEKAFAKDASKKVNG
jgi:hypothetical protein